MWPSDSNSLVHQILYWISSPVSGMPCARCMRELSTSLADTKKMRLGACWWSTTFSSSTRNLMQRSVCCFLTWKRKEELTDIEHQYKSSTVVLQTPIVIHIAITISVKIITTIFVPYHFALLHVKNKLARELQQHVRPPCTRARWPRRPSGC